MPKLGEKAPDFNALNQNRERFILSKAVKKGPVMLAFYPGDDTPVCTAQLCDYRDHYDGFKELGIQIYGISISTTEKQEKFAKNQSFPFPLLNDYDARITKEYGIMSFLGIPKRAIFLIDQEMKVIYRHVEFLPVTRRTSEELIKKMKEILPAKSRETTETA